MTVSDDPTRSHLRMALAEAGYPEATVWGVDDDGPWFCDDVPADAWDRACEVVNRCKGTQRLSTGTIDGETPEQLISCPWCGALPVAPRPEDAT